ncbi:MAG: lipoprotein [Rickettsia endosymbiont of Pentastiridius leporinus]
MKALNLFILAVILAGCGIKKPLDPPVKNHHSHPAA